MSRQLGSVKPKTTAALRALADAGLHPSQRADVRAKISEGMKLAHKEGFGRYVVDAYVPEWHLAFEADGATWHSYPQQVERDKVRDEYLMDRFSLPVVRLLERELTKMEV